MTSEGTIVSKTTAAFASAHGLERIEGHVVVTC
jgi:hypothetical protein